MILSVFVTLCVWLRFELRRLRGTCSDTNLYSNFEIVWLLRPVLVFVTLGLLSLTITYELMGVEWVDVILNLVAAQWYWNENFMLEGQENSTMVSPFVTHSSVSDKWAIGATTLDVLHSISIKDLGFHTDCIPGKYVVHDYVDYLERIIWVSCQELCGYGHSRMVIRMEIE
jgi:heme/copper-type cytochrome/quinol oxidase subunit 2